MSELDNAVAVTYDGLPISSGGSHSLGRMSRREAYARTVGFLNTCTDPTGEPKYWFPPFTGGVTSPERVANALDYLDRIHPQPTNAAGMAPVWLRMSCAFRLLDPRTRLALQWQRPEPFRAYDVPSDESGLTLYLENRASLAISLFIPTADRETLTHVIPWLQEHLPAKMSPKHWTAWSPTKVGTFRGRKLDVAAFLT